MCFYIKNEWKRGKNVQKVYRQIFICLYSVNSTLNWSMSRLRNELKKLRGDYTINICSNIVIVYSYQESKFELLFMFCFAHFIVLF